MKKYDLIIIGGGGAGLAAANRALELGVKSIAILESGKRTGGNAAAAGGYIYALDTPQLKNSGLNSASEELREALDFHHYDYINPALIRRWLDETKNTISWLESRGFEFVISNLGEGYSHVMSDSPGVAWFHKILTPLAAELREKSVDIISGVTVTGIRLEDGAVTGAYGKTTDGEAVEYSAGSVLLACGGFMNNEELLRKYFPQYYKPNSSFGVVRAPANGIDLAVSAGAKVNMECTLVKETGMCFKPGPHSPGRIFAMNGTVLVNRQGKRFVDESHWNQNYSANAMLHQPDKIAYAIYSRETLESVMSDTEPFDFKSEKEAYMAFLSREAEKAQECVFADTLEQLAAWIGAKPEALRATVREYNSFCENGTDLALGKNARFLLPLLTGPYLAVRVNPMYIDTIGPVVINEDMQVLNDNCEPIPGFYAAGVITAGWEGRDYMRFGSALSYCLTSGRMAAASIAKEQSGL